MPPACASSVAFSSLFGQSTKRRDVGVLLAGYVSVLGMYLRVASPLLRTDGRAPHPPAADPDCSLATHCSKLPAVASTGVWEPRVGRGRRSAVTL